MKLSNKDSPLKDVNSNNARVLSRLKNFSMLMRNSSPPQIDTEIGYHQTKHLKLQGFVS